MRITDWKEDHVLEMINDSHHPTQMAPDAQNEG